LSRSIFELMFQHRLPSHFTERHAVYNVMISNVPERTLILTHDNIRASYISPLSSMDSGLDVLPSGLPEGKLLVGTIFQSGFFVFISRRKQIFVCRFADGAAKSRGLDAARRRS
jgi:hypothetical protein